MADWEKEKGINLQKKKNEKKRLNKVLLEDKENHPPAESSQKETLSEKDGRILKESQNQVLGWIEKGVKEG